MSLRLRLTYFTGTARPRSSGSQLGEQLSIKQFTIEQAVKRLDILYSNDKYSELDLGQTLEMLAMQVEATEPPRSGAIDVPRVSASIS
jgi:hypothetical protein